MKNINFFNDSFKIAFSKNCKTIRVIINYINYFIWLKIILFDKIVN